MRKKSFLQMLLTLVLLFAMMLSASCGAAKPKVSDKPAPGNGSQPSESAPEKDSQSAAGSAEGEQITFTDDLGQEFAIDRPRRVVAMIGSFADIWMLAGGEDSLVATANDAWESYELDLDENVANIGSGMKPNAELVLQAQPDLILASTISSSNLDLKETFDKSGIPAAYFNVASFEDYLDLLEVCTRLTGKEENFKKYGTEVKKQVENAVARQDGSAPRVLNLQVSGSSCTVKNSEDNVLGEMLNALGCTNIADKNGALLEDLSLEAIIEADPDYIFAVYHGTDAAGAQANLEKTLLENPAWSKLRAVKEGRFFLLERRLYNLKPNALWGEAYEKLADLLYGEK